MAPSRASSGTRWHAAAWIAIIDDHDDARAIVRDALPPGAPAAREFACFEDALASLRAMPPALVVTDLKLPGMSGTSVARWLRAEPSTRGVPIVCVSGMYEPDADLLAMFDAFFEEPLDRERFRATVADLLAARLAPSSGRRSR